MSRIKSFHTYLTKENSNQLIMKYIRHKVTDDMGWMKPGMADWGIYSGDNLVAVFYLDDEKPDLFIRGLEIKEEFRGKGYGKKVLDLIRNYAKSKKYKFLTLNFYKSNDIAKKLYSVVLHIDLVSKKNSIVVIGPSLREEIHSSIKDYEMNI